MACIVTCVTAEEVNFSSLECLFDERLANKMTGSRKPGGPHLQRDNATSLYRMSSSLDLLRVTAILVGGAC